MSVLKQLPSVAIVFSKEEKHPNW